jgi:hypothetical protein
VRGKHRITVVVRIGLDPLHERNQDRRDRGIVLVDDPQRSGAGGLCEGAAARLRPSLNVRLLRSVAHEIERCLADRAQFTASSNFCLHEGLCRSVVA